MKTLWAPWRLEYILDDTPDKKTGCIFCPRIAGNDDETNLLVYRAPRTVAILNRYPYSNGHLLVMPQKHTGELDDLDGKELLELMEVTRLCLRALKRTMKPDAFNVGFNLGKGEAAGAGVPNHLHLHIVPRWAGDTSFMPVLADVKIMPEHLTQTFHKLKQALAELSGQAQ
jgi:ATP adenylyltransferase